MEPTCPPPSAHQPAWFALVESDCPGLLLASRALGGKRGVAVPNIKSGTPNPVFQRRPHCGRSPQVTVPTVSPLRGGRCSPRSTLRPQLRTATQLRTFSQGLPDPGGSSSHVLSPGSFSRLLSAPQLLANRFPTDPHPTFTSDPLSTGSQVVLSPE